MAVRKAKSKSPAKPEPGIAVKEGDKAPAFRLPASDGSRIGPADFKDKKAVVLYFYPKDDTSGCTVEACEFGAEHDKFLASRAVVLGLSPDPVESHQRFIQKFKLPFLLLADTDKAVCQLYGTWVKKSMYGHEYMGVQRATLLLDKQGRVAKVWPKVTPKGHAAQVLEAIRALEEKAS